MKAETLDAKAWKRLPIAKLDKAAWNYKLDDADLAAKLRANIERNGQIENMLVRAVGRRWEVVNGNHRLDALAALGHTHAVVYDLGAVTLEHAQRVAVETNETRFASDPDRLAATIAAFAPSYDLPDLSLTLPYSTDALEQMIAESAPTHHAQTEEEVESAPPLRSTSIQRGDLFVLGAHRILCGDSTDPSDVARVCDNRQADVVLTDPPYNVDLDYGDQTVDDKTASEYLHWTRRWFSVAKSQSLGVVVTCGIVNVGTWIADVEKTHRIIAWVKENQCSRNYIGAIRGFNVWEPILVYGKVRGVMRDSFSIPIHMQADAAGHPCPKSIRAWSWLIENFSESGDMIFDPFSGSGTTLIGCQQLGRRAAAIDIEPKFVQLAIDRWERLTGRKAVQA